MKRTFTALITAATLSAVGAPGAIAMENEHTMLVGAVYKELDRLDLPTDRVMDLSLGQIGAIRGCANSADSNNMVKQCVESILRR